MRWATDIIAAQTATLPRPRVRPRPPEKLWEACYFFAPARYCCSTAVRRAKSFVSYDRDVIKPAGRAVVRAPLPDPVLRAVEGRERRVDSGAACALMRSTSSTAVSVFSTGRSRYCWCGGTMCRFANTSDRM